MNRGLIMLEIWSKYLLVVMLTLHIVFLLFNVTGHVTIDR